MTNWSLLYLNPLKETDFQAKTSFAFAASDAYKLGTQPGMMVHICNPSTWEAEARGLSGT